MRQHYSDSLLGTVLLVVGLLSVPAAIALAVPDEGSAYPENQADLEPVIEQLQAENPGLSKDEAMELAGLASSEVSREVLKPAGVDAGENREGIILHSPTHPGIPEVGTGPQMTPEEQAISEKVGTRANELAGQGLSKEQVDGALRQEFEKEFKQFEAIASGERDDAKFKELNYRELPEGRPDLGHEPTSQEREQMERYHEQPTREIPTREAVERPAYERQSPEGGTPSY